VSFLSRAAALGAACFVVVACGASDSGPTNNGVNDVLKACQVRAAWTTPDAEKCVSCVAVADLAECGCEATKPFGGACVKQGDAVRAEATCTNQMKDCVIACKKDCACIDGCYANAPACKTVTAARDGCVAETCTPYCNPDAGVTK
jgi:hypothetical protein